MDWENTDKLVRKFAKNLRVTPDDFDDFVQEVLMVLLEYDQEKIEELINKGHFDFWLSRTMMNMYCSTTSRWYYKYKKYQSKIERAIDLTREEHKEWGPGNEDEENPRNFWD